MCCNATESAKEKLLKRFGSKKELWLWKCVSKFHKKALCFYAYQYKDGWNHPHRTCTINIDSLGLHVHLTRQYAQSWKDHGTEKIIRVKVLKKDLVAADKKTAIFKKIWIKKEDLVK